MIEVKYKTKKYKLPNLIRCDKDGGVMGYDIKKKAYVCINVEGCTNKKSIKEVIKNQKEIKNQELGF